MVYFRRSPLHESLTILDLGSNDLGPEGTRSLQALEKNRCLKVLKLQNCNINSEGARSVAALIKIALNLSINNCGAEGAITLSHSLTLNQSLLQLELFNCQIGQEGTQALLEALRENTTLRSIDLRYNQIGSNGAQTILTLLARCYFLTSLSLGANEIDSHILHEIEQKMAANQAQIEEIATLFRSSQLIFCPKDNGVFSILPREINRLIAYHLAAPASNISLQQVQVIVACCVRRQNLTRKIMKHLLDLNVA